MATQLAKITKSGGKYQVTFPADLGDFKAGTVTAKNGDDAIDLQDRYNELAEAKALTGGRKAPTGLNYSVEGSKLTMVIDLAGNHGTTKGTTVKGKNGQPDTVKGGGNTLIASTHGAIVIPFKRDDGKEINVSVNAYGK